MHIIWDWNGTLFDDLHIVVDAVNASLAAIDSDLRLDADGYRDHYRRPVREFYDAMLPRPVTDAEWEIINDVFHEAYVDLLHLAQPAGDAHQAIAAAQDRRVSQSILSMWAHHQLVPTVAAHRLDLHMAAVRGADMARGERKQELLIKHLAELPADGRVVMIGDTFDDAVAASQAGIEMIFYNGGSHHRDDLVATGVPVADTLLQALELAVTTLET